MDDEGEGEGEGIRTGVESIGSFSSVPARREVEDKYLGHVMNSV